MSSSLAQAEAYAIRHAYGNHPDDTDEDELDEGTKLKLAEATPNTRRTLLVQIEEEKVGKIGPASTFFTLLKGFVAAGVLFLPKGFVTGGWLFSSAALIFSCFLTIVWSLKLVDIRKKYKLSYSEIGFKAYGLPGKIAVDFFLAFTQTIFVCAYISFIVSSVNGILKAQFKYGPINDWILGGVWFLVFAPMWWVRKIEKFAVFHVFADMAIAIGLTVIIIFASLELSDNGFTGPHEPINTVTFLSFIGLAAYTFEGIGIIIPVMEQCSRPDLYPHIIVGVISLVTTVYIFFGNYIYFIYGLDKVGEHPLVTDILPAKNIAVAIVDVIWIINLILTYPLVLYPATMVFESYVYAKVAKSPKRRWMKNLTRSMFVAFTVVLSVSLLDTLDKLESINGAFACIPLAFTLPALFHYKLRAETRTEKIIDLFIAALTFVLMIVWTVVTFVYWNQ